MNELALFAGAGGGILGGQLLGWRTVCAVECEPYAASLLAQRQNDGVLPPFPIWDDVCTFDGTPWRGSVDVVSGGFPCQDISSAGSGKGIEGERSGLWSEMARIISEVRPKFVFVENSGQLVTKGLALVISDLASMGYDAAWGVLGAADVGAPHQRDRLWIVAKKCFVTHEDVDEWGFCVLCRCSEADCECPGLSDFLADTTSERQPGQGESINTSDTAQGDYRQAGEPKHVCVGQEWQAEPGVGRVADGVAFRLDRLKAIGNGQVPAVAAVAFLELTKRLP